ncbi:acyltransferase family protein [Bosea sp. Tri-49]|uniref:acyltransferase family protein n=1 Tax=Bosea sp. Tri-49 TaxID=1867715 RepID=UPI0013DE8B23|nr:acyltransferase [Bosea sp. Tri-49]
MRGLACLLVIFLHVVIAPLPLSPGSWFDLARFRIQPFLIGGVDLFFILSGFLIAGILMDSRSSPNYFRSFWLARASRIFPVYYLMIAFSLVMNWVNANYPSVTAHLVGHATLSIWYYVAFVQNFALALLPGGRASLGVTWSLAIEEQFYLVLPFLVLLFRRRALVALAIGIILATPVIRAWVVQSVNWNAGYIITVCRLDALMMGFLVACIVRHDRSLDLARRAQWSLNWLAVFLIVLQLADFWGAVGQILERSGNSTVALVLICAQYPLINLAMACLLLNVFTREAGPLRWVFKTKILMTAGLVSYGAYMYHQVVNNALWGLLYGTGPSFKGWHHIYMPVLVLMITAVISWLSLRYFEMPVRRWAKERRAIDRASIGTMAAERG